MHMVYVEKRCKKADVEMSSSHLGHWPPVPKPQLQGRSFDEFCVCIWGGCACRVLLVFHCGNINK